MTKEGSTKIVNFMTQGVTRVTYDLVYVVIFRRNFSTLSRLALNVQYSFRILMCTLKHITGIMRMKLYQYSKFYDLELCYGVKCIIS